MLFLCSEKDQLRFKSFNKFYSLNKRIFLHDLVPYHKLSATLSSANLGLILNYKPDWPSHWFSLPNRIFDYIHADLDILSTKQPEFLKVIEKYNIGRTFEFMNEKSFVENILNCIHNSGFYRTSTEAAKNENNWDREKNKFIGIYKNI